MQFSLTGSRDVQRALTRIDAPRLQAIVKMNMVEIYNRGKRPNGTPVLTGELRQSLGISNSSDTYVVGYTKDYAPHVEYGHRTVGGGFVQGQYYLRNNVQKQEKQLQRDLQDAMRKAVRP